MAKLEIRARVVPMEIRARVVPKLFGGGADPIHHHNQSAILGRSVVGLQWFDVSFL